MEMEKKKIFPHSYFFPVSQKSIYSLKSHSCLDLDTSSQLVAEFLTILWEQQN